jgi:hypothetical protein
MTWGILLRNRFVREEPMKKQQWKLRRQFVVLPDAQPRWDRVYQNLLRWTQCPSWQPVSQPVAQARLPQEE